MSKAGTFIFFSTLYLTFYIYESLIMYKILKILKIFKAINIFIIYNGKRKNRKSMAMQFLYEKVS